jgi:hypothetical protein
MEEEHEEQDSQERKSSEFSESSCGCCREKSRAARGPSSRGFGKVSRDSHHQQQQQEVNVGTQNPSPKSFKNS